MAPQRFQKIKDKSVKKPLKRLAAKQHKKDRTYTQKLANSLKRRALNSAANHNFKRKLNFQANVKQAAELVQSALPKPKFYRNTKATDWPKLRNDTIEEGEIIEEIGSSDDDDDCYITKVHKNLVPRVELVDDSSSDESTSSPSANGSNFVVDTKREALLAWSTTNKCKVNYAVKNNCIVLDDSLEPLTPRKRGFVYEPEAAAIRAAQATPPTNLDDSVIIVEDHKQTSDFIPFSESPKQMIVPTTSKPQAAAKIVKAATQAAVKVVKAATPKRLRMSESLFTSTERKKLLDYNSNTYNPGEDDSIPTNHKRFIIIDGSNVAFGHGCSKVFSAEGIKYSLEYFETLGHSVKAVIPQFRKNPHKSTNPALLDQLYKDGKIVFTPCKNLPTQQSISYDDRFILQLAYERNAAVVSNDNYRDLIHENPAFKKIVENRVIGYSWCDNIFILPKDPYGRFGPQLAEILRC